MAKGSNLREADLYGPIRDYLMEQGYTVQGEVRGCDMVAQKEDDLIVIELKRSFSTRLLIQAIDRQKITDSVYVALPGPYSLARGARGKRWREIKRLLRRLELGLIVVTFSGDTPWVQVVFHPLPYQQQKRKKRKRAVIREMNARSGSYNVGGSARSKVVTAYRENVIHIACCLEQLGPLAPRELRALDTGPKTASILSSNFYGWFRRVERGVYEITAQGGADLGASPPDLVAHYRQRVEQGISAAQAAAEDTEQ
jgi:hypothetical protein